MKAIKFLLVSLMVMLGTAAFAQDVVIHKTDGTVDVFKPNEVDSVVYEPITDYGYYREDDSYKSQDTTTGWINLDSSSKIIPWSKVKNIAISTTTNVAPTLEVHSKLSGNWVNWRMESASLAGKSPTIKIKDKIYYLWLNPDITAEGDDDYIRITINK